RHDLFRRQPGLPRPKLRTFGRRAPTGAQQAVLAGGAPRRDRRRSAATVGCAGRRNMTTHPSPRIAVYGAYGHTGRFVVAELLRRGFVPVACGRDAARLQELAATTGAKPRRSS